LQRPMGFGSRDSETLDIPWSLETQIGVLAVS
jgi:hypothetical protein